MSHKILTFDDRDFWLEARKTRIGGSRAKEAEVKSAITKEKIMSQLNEAGVEYDKKMKKDELEALMTSDMQVNIMEQADPSLLFYKLVAERLTIPGKHEDPLEHGVSYEEEGMQRFAKETGKDVDTSLVMWVRKDNEAISVSPDGVISETEALEQKCLSSERHIKAFFEGIPEEHMPQVRQYFIVNDKLETLYFSFYDPRLTCKEFFYYTVKREEVQAEVDLYLNYQKRLLANVDRVVAELSF